MKWDEVIELEKRTEEDLYKINLILEGEFWHGYEWSAYLATHYKTSIVCYSEKKKIKKNLIFY